METNQQKSFYVMLESQLIYDKRLTNTSKILYSIISSFSNNQKGYCFLSYKQLANIMNITKRQVLYCVNELVKYDYIKKITTEVHTYLMPITNLMLKMRSENPEKFKALFNYDWLNDND